MSVEVDSRDVLKLIAQFLKEHGLKKTLGALQDETQVAYNAVEDKKKVTQMVVDGNWEELIREVGSLYLPRGFLMDLYEHILFELAEEGKHEISARLLGEAPPLLEMRQEDPARYSRLKIICQRNYFDPSECYPESSKQNRRRTLSNVVSELLEDEKETEKSRLLTLLSQSLKWQQFTGLLPKGSSIDLFRNKPLDDVDVVDLPPLRNDRTIKFGKASAVDCCIFSPDGQHLISGSADGFIEVWDFDTGKINEELEYQANDRFMMHSAAIISLAFSKDGQYLASGCQNGEVKVWHLLSGKCIKKIQKAHTSGVSSLEFTSNGSQILSASFDETIKLWGLKSGTALKELRGHNAYVHVARISPLSSSHVFSGGDDGTLRKWDLSRMECLRVTNVDKGNPVIDIQFMTSEEGKIQNISSLMAKMLVMTKTNTINVLNFSGDVLLCISPESSRKGCSEFISMAISPRARFIYVVGDDSVLYCMSTRNGELVKAVKIHEMHVGGIAHHPLRNILASFSTDKTLKIWRP